MNDWWNNHANLAALFKWLDARDEIDDVGYFLEKPWKWERERNDMLAEQAAAEADAKARAVYDENGAEDPRIAAADHANQVEKDRRWEDGR